ncbi:glucoamylase family protein [Oscillospiraceae bacterium 44-34]
MSNTPYVPMDDAHLKQYAANAAREAKPEGTVPCRTLVRELKADLKTVCRIREALNLWSAGQSDLPGSAEWLLDNHYMAVREGERAREAFRGGKPLRGTGKGAALLWCCAQSALWAVPELDQDRLALFLEGFQSVCPLTERELSLFVPALSGTLVGRLTQLCGDLEALKEGRVPAEELEAVFKALRALSGAEWSDLLERASRVEQILNRDPSGQYPHMDEDTRRRYRQRVCRLAKKNRLEEGQAARRALELAQKGEGPRRHVGWYLYREPLGKGERSRSGVSYGVVVLGLSLLASLALWQAAGTPLAAVLLILPLSDIVKNVLDFLLVRLVPPRPVPRMELEGGIPQEGRTLCVVVSLLTGEDSGPKLAALLERYRLANRDAGPELRLGVLADLPDSGVPMGEEGTAWMDSARRAIDSLNEKYGGGFYLFFRPPKFSKRDERYMGWERKRGALTELVRLLKGKVSGLEVKAGERSWLRQVRYVITLDSDTSLNVGTARELTGAMLHPLNQPVIDPKRKIVTAGHALFQPRVAVELEAANKSFFAKIFGGLGGVDPYGSTASDVYHDLFDQGTYTGKGVFSVDAFYTCLDGRFPENAILSHDLLEGSYLRAGLLGEVEVTDGCPWQVYGYFARLHRWIRGDWQLMPWLGRRVPDGRSGQEDNPLPPLAKWKILDNLRRSLSPIFTLLTLVLGMCFSGRVFAWAGGVAVVAAASNLLLSGAELAVRRSGKRRRYHSTVIAGLAGAILQTAVQLIFLPYQAYISLTAICAALWRMAVSHKNLLAWVTAAQTEKGKGSVPFYYKKAWFSAAVGIFVVFFAQLRFGKAVGVIWLLAPALAWAVSRPSRQGRALPPADRAFLLHQATLIWRYFAGFLRPEDHFLPPDNWQEQPGPVLARRTSPTNIGMALLSVMAAVDLELLPRKRAVELISHILDTVERLEKWKGHLYNWYDTATLVPLRPQYVSTVDSGNLRGCLIALREGLYQWGEDVLARRAEDLSNAMDCAPLFDQERKLFSIGYEVEQDRLTDGYYDLMASEARQASFISVARGEVPARHWRRLGRMLLGDNDYCGMASWTGTMFEYFMPSLLLPCEPNSFLYETLSFCVYAQKRRGDKTKKPWGISESGFYAFDPGMSYQYKAHGVQALGLKRGLDSELVVSPYSSFLALLLAPRSALRNLRRLRDLGLEGRYGLYEAVDYTPARLAGDEDFEVVRSYMSHHLGMSLIAIDNVLQGNIMQKRFMKDCDMSAYRELLQERVPVGAPVIRQEERDFPFRPRPAAGPTLIREGKDYGRKSPQCHLLSNGGYSILTCDNGLTASKAGELSITLTQPGRYYAPAGVSVFFHGPDGLYGLTPAPLYQSGAAYRWEFNAAGACWCFEREGLSARMSLSIPQRENGEARRVELRWSGKTRLDGELLFYLEPVLCPQRDFDAHPAFSRLFLEGAFEGNSAIFHRRLQGDGEGPYLAVLWTGEGSSASLDRSAALGRGGLRALPSRTRRLLEAGTGSDPCLMVRIPVSLKPGERAVFSLVLALGDTAQAAQERADRMLSGRDGGPASLAPIVQKLALSEREVLMAFDLLARLTAELEPALDCPPQNALWPYGISGDLPIAAGQLSGEEEGKRAALWCRWHQLLIRAGYPFDLVLILEEGGDYRRPLRSTLMEELKRLGAQSALGAKGGVHLVGPDAAPAVLAWAKAILPLEERENAEEIAPPPPVTLSPEPAPWEMVRDTAVIRCGGRLPPVGWSQVLCNPEFGWVTDETGAGFLWSGGNSREGRLTPWNNDPLAVGGQETVMVSLDGREHSVFAAGDGLACTVTYGPGFARWEKELPGASLTVEGFVPPDENRRILRFTLAGGAGRLICRMGEGETLSTALADGQSVSLVTRESGGSLCSRFFREDFRVEQERALIWWADKVSALTVKTPDSALNRYLSGWCLYQVIACRMMARTSQYQNGGAFGFRDQLQDAASLLYTWPQRTREQLLLAASRQFEEGDVQHWWHPPQGAGVRTRISDDLLWLPWVLCRYCAVTGDWKILEEEVPYLAAKPLEPGEKDRYEVPVISESRENLYRHGLGAIQCALSRGTGPHGLARMGSGDWNDGMDKVGGESVWLTWFLAAVLQDFAVLCRRMDEEARADDLLRQADSLIQAAQGTWDGDWYRRGYYEDGSPLGSAQSGQCQIDSIAQSFAVFPGGTDRRRADRAVSAALERLFDREAGVVRLFDPAFDGQEDNNPGYIRSYPAGVRENGGQYTHASVWLAMACFRLDRPEDGWAVLKALLPEGHETNIYRAEPYVIAADVSYAPGRVGRAGWSWYTGAAGWYWQIAVQELLGLRMAEGKLTVEPNLPLDWPGYEVVWRLSKGTLNISVKRTGDYSAALDGRSVKDGVPLRELTGEHRLEVTI